MKISIDLNEQDAQLFRTYAENNNMTISELILTSVYSKIEQCSDLNTSNNSYDNYSENPISYSQEAVLKIFGFGK